jgi:hypothetical protein
MKSFNVSATDTSERVTTFVYRGGQEAFLGMCSSCRSLLTLARAVSGGGPVA